MQGLQKAALYSLATVGVAAIVAAIALFALSANFSPSDEEWW